VEEDLSYAGEVSSAHQRNPSTENHNRICRLSHLGEGVHQHKRAAQPHFHTRTQEGLHRKNIERNSYLGGHSSPQLYRKRRRGGRKMISRSFNSRSTRRHQLGRGSLITIRLPGLRKKKIAKRRKGGLCSFSTARETSPLREGIFFARDDEIGGIPGN